MSIDHATPHRATGHRRPAGRLSSEPGLWRVVRYGRIGFGRRRRWGDRGHRLWLRRVVSPLDANPGQEKVIRDAVDETVSAAQELRGELFASPEEMAKALRIELFDETVMAELLTRHDDALDRLRQTAVGSLQIRTGRRGG